MTQRTPPQLYRIDWDDWIYRSERLAFQIGHSPFTRPCRVEGLGVEDFKHLTRICACSNHMLYKKCSKNIGSASTAPGSIVLRCRRTVGKASPAKTTCPADAVRTPTHATGSTSTIGSLHLVALPSARSLRLVGRPDNWED